MKQSAFLIILPYTGRILRLMFRAELYADFASLRKLTKRLKSSHTFPLFRKSSSCEDGYNKSCEKRLFRKSYILFTGKETKLHHGG